MKRLSEGSAAKIPEQIVRVGSVSDRHGELSFDRFGLLPFAEATA